MIVRSTLYTSRGGDTIQAMQTARMLRRQGINVDIILTDEKIEYRKYNLLHFFNITRPADILHHVGQTDKPYVVSTILVDYSEYDKHHRKGFSGIALKYFDADTIEYIKSIGRWLRRSDRLMSIPYVWKGQKKAIIEIMKKATLLLPNSAAEYGKLKKQYNCSTQYMVVPNGIDEDLFAFDKSMEKDPRLVLCVARIEGVKNQMTLIRALNDTGYTLIIIGEPSPNQMRYYNACRKMASGNIHFIGHLPQKELVHYYQRAKVHVLPSWFETTGLSSLEGAAMGCSIVVTDKGFTKAYFGNHAVYCDPSSAESIYAAVKNASLLPNNEKLRSQIRTFYTWRQAGLCTAEGYKRVINESWD